MSVNPLMMLLAVSLVVAVFGIGYMAVTRKMISNFVGSADEESKSKDMLAMMAATMPSSTPPPAMPTAMSAEGFAPSGMMPSPTVVHADLAAQRSGSEHFANPSEPSNVPFAAGNAPSNCYPKAQLNATELLPADPNSKWAQVNPQGAGDIAGKNYLNAGALIGVNTVGQSLRNASWDLRSEPANPQVAVSPWFNSTIEPDINRRVLEIQ